MIESIQIADADATETCQYYNSFCTQLDFLVRAQLGAPTLNRITSISLYFTLRSEYGWNSNIWQANDALKVLIYTIEKPEFLGPSSVVYDYNSQAVGARPEFLVVGVNDQGFTGANGLSQCYKGEEFRGMGEGTQLSCGLRINITVVAVNDPPIITTPFNQYYTPRENVALRLARLGVVDNDVSEVTTSAMALDDWVSLPENANYLNKIKIRLSVLKGILLLNPSARDLTATMNATQMWIAISRYMAGHDSCRALPCIQNPASCDTGPNRSRYPAVAYQDVCSFRQNTPETARFAQSSCEGGNCTCLILNDCSGTGDILLYLNTSKEQRGGIGGRLKYIALLYDVLPLQDATCGGMPFFVSPNDFSWGKRCRDNMDCQPPKMQERCIPGVTCRCCADLNLVCDADDDCKAFSPYGTCGCTPGLDPPCAVTGGCFCCNNMSVSCNTDGDCGPRDLGPALGNRSKCGCDPQRNSMCGPFGQALPNGDPGLRVGTKQLLTGGAPCQYHGTKSGVCLPPVVLSLGSQNSDILAQMQTDGSATLELYGPITQINSALTNIRYNTTNQHYLNYNKRYRPPIELRRAPFDIQKNDADALTVYVNDMGNTGGTGRRCMLCTKHAACNADCSVCDSMGERPYAGCWAENTYTVLVSSTNSPPKVTAPLNIAMLEGQAYTFLNTDRLYTLDGVLARRVGPQYVVVYAPPPPEVLAIDKSCNDTAGAFCVPVWGPTLKPTVAQQLQYFPDILYQVRAAAAFRAVTAACVAVLPLRAVHCVAVACERGRLAGPAVDKHGACTAGARTAPSRVPVRAFFSRVLCFLWCARTPGLECEVLEH
jgi:hypothetical protein